MTTKKEIHLSIKLGNPKGNSWAGLISIWCNTIILRPLQDSGFLLKLTMIVAVEEQLVQLACHTRKRKGETAHHHAEPHSTFYLIHFNRVLLFKHNKNYSLFISKYWPIILIFFSVFPLWGPLASGAVVSSGCWGVLQGHGVVSSGSPMLVPWLLLSFDFLSLPG